MSQKTQWFLCSETPQERQLRQAAGGNGWTVSPQRALGEPPLWLSNETLRDMRGDRLTSWSHTKDIFWTLCFSVRSHSVALTGLSLTILLPPSPESWNYRHVPPWPVAIFWITCGDLISTYSQDGGWALLVEWWPGALPLCPPPTRGLDLCLELGTKKTWPPSILCNFCLQSPVPGDWLVFKPPSLMWFWCISSKGMCLKDVFFNCSFIKNVKSMTKY